MNYKTVTIEGIDLDVEFEYEAGFRGNREEPPEPPEIELVKITVQGVDIIEIMSHESIKDVLGLLLEDAQ